MNQDFTVQKKQYLSEKKKFVQRGLPEKKNSCTSSERKKKFVQAENSDDESMLCAGNRKQMGAM